MRAIAAKAFLALRCVGIVILLGIMAITGLIVGLWGIWEEKRR